MNQITTEVVNRLIWVEVLDSDGRIGWIPATYLTIITPTSTKTLTVTLTSTGIPTNTTFVSPDNGSNFEGAEYLEAGCRYSCHLPPVVIRTATYSLAHLFGGGLF